MMNSTTSNSTAGEAETVKVIKALCYCVIMLMSLVGNTLVIIIIFRNTRMRTTTNNLIANMAISDLLFPLFAVPKEIAQIVIGKSRWLVVGIGGEILCKFVNFSQDISTAVSILSLVVIAFDRFHAVKFPFQPAVITPKICRIVICLIWVVAVGLHSTYFYTFKLIVEGNDIYCKNEWEPAFETASTQKVYFLIIFLVLIFFPIAVIIILYTAIAIEVWKQKGPTEHSCRERQRREQENRRVLKQVVTVVVVFVSCITPVTIFSCLLLFVWNIEKIPPGIDEVNFHFCALFIMHSNAAISPCIYFIFNKNYRKGLSEIYESCARIFTGLENQSLDATGCTKPKYNSKVERVAKIRSPKCQYI